jgi:hypothetical protein
LIAALDALASTRFLPYGRDMAEKSRARKIDLLGLAAAIVIVCSVAIVFALLMGD